MLHNYYYHAGGISLNCLRNVQDYYTNQIPSRQRQEGLTLGYLSLGT